MRCCLDALHAVLRCLVSDKSPDESFYEMRTAVENLTLTDMDSLDKLRRDLNSEELSQSCDWESLERVLGLRPLFFRLLRVTRGGGIGPSTRSIGPQAGA